MKRVKDTTARGLDADRLDELDELQVVSKREYRRGYRAQVNGELTRMRYGKIMNLADGHVLVFRPAIGDERRKDLLWGLPRALGLFLFIAWPVTGVAIIVLVAAAVAGVRGLFG
jgi:hypothetical protein